ncbi:cell division control protein Cdc6 [Blastomyces gilchristii SLH14081]|uniref:Cell division control protein n=1 Tax=Blastomyces gilchristii (strain SLH14081) TaxID=559298 RepID=A0A179UZL3_BLAGS|nr:cell division control protein Cdc6 [Blastomyces gilchristii SLH14081]OAT12669.1 cell division control protein Cdc6 [Blastomyces gilchristii SLH14081]
MASSVVLGKRLRNADNASVAISLRSSKRQAQVLPQPQIHEEEESNDENDELSIPHSTGCRSRQRRRGVTTTTKRRTLPVRNVRSKHTVPDKTIDESISPSNTAIIPDENTRPYEFTTPKTPSRYRDALSHNNDNTKIKPVPVTPRHRVQVFSSGRPLTPRTPRMIASPAPVQTVYTPARQLFARSATPGRLVGRDSERQELSSFIQNAVQSRQGGCMYVSGPPGTGKSAMVDELCQDLSVDVDLKKETIKIARINCASMTNSKDIYAKLADELCEDPQLFKQSRTELLAGMFVQKKRTSSSATPSALFLVALDEIDHLLTTDVETLYTLFEWSLQPHSRLVLIGIANALDLTDRFLPRLKSKNMKPLLLPFLPYTASQIAGIISTRLRSLLPTSNNAKTTATIVPEDFTPFLHPAAIQLCARKVASQTGDLRKAFDIVRRTIDLVEQQTRQTQKPSSSYQSPSKIPLVENANLASSLISPPDTPSSSSSSSSSMTPATATVYTPVTAPRATVAHVARVTASAFGQGTVQRLQGLNLQQKAALCVLIALGRRKVDNRDSGILDTPSLSKSPRSTKSSVAAGVVAAPTVNELFVTYSGLCRRDKILQPLAATEFRDVIGSLETLGLVGEAQAQGRGRGSTSATGGVGGGPAGLRTPSKPKTPTRMAGRVTGAGADERMLVCFVGEGEVEKLICGEGEGILRGLFRAEV